MDEVKAMQSSEEEKMSRLTRLFELASAALAIGICFNPPGANAVTLSIGTNSYGAPGIGCIAFQSPISNPDLSACTNSNLPITTIPAQSLNINGFTITANDQNKPIILIANAPTVMTRTGISANGVILNLSNLKITRNSNNTSNQTAPDIVFSNDFSYSFNSNQTNFLDGFKTFTGQFVAFSENNNVVPGDSSQFNGTITDIFNGTLRIQTFPVLSSGTLSDLTTPAVFPQSGPSSTTITYPAAQGNATVKGIVTTSLARPGESMVLTNSACIVVVEQNSFSSQNAQDSCGELVPEPSAVLSLLSFGTLLGLGSLLKRKYSSTDPQ